MRSINEGWNFVVESFHDALLTMTRQFLSNDPNAGDDKATFNPKITKILESFATFLKLPERSELSDVIHTKKNSSHLIQSDLPTPTQIFSLWVRFWIFYKNNYLPFSNDLCTNFLA